MMRLSNIILGVLMLGVGILVLGVGRAQAQMASPSVISEEEKNIIEEDRRMLEEALATGRSTKIMAARKQLSDDLARFAESRRKDIDGISIPLIPDNEGHFFVEVIINQHIHASLMVDTGAPVVMLSSRFARELGVAAERHNVGYMMILNGKHAAAQVALRSLKLGRAEKHNVMAAVLLDRNAELEDKFKDGLLGLSFLKGYHFTIDQKRQRLILRKAE